MHSALIFERVTRTFFVYCPECYSGILRKLRIIQNILPIHNRSCARRWFAVYPPPLRLTPYTLHPLGQLLPNDSGTFHKKVLFLRFSPFVPPLYLPYKRPTMNQGTTYLLPTLKKCCLLSEGVRRNALRVLRPKSPHSEEIAQYIEWRTPRAYAAVWL